MTPGSGKVGGRRPPKKNNEIGSAVLHYCLRQQAETIQKHHEFVQSLKKENSNARPLGNPGGVALGGTISRHRTLEFLSGALFNSPNPSKGSAPSKHAEQHLRSVIERSGLDEYVSTALAAQDSISIDRYEARRFLLNEPTSSYLVSSEKCRDTNVEDGAVPIPRRPLIYSKSMAEAQKEVMSKEASCNKTMVKNQRRRNRTRVKLLLAGKIEEATVQNIQFVRQQRDELHRRYQKAKDASKRPGRRPRSNLKREASEYPSAEGCGDEEDDVESEGFNEEAAESESEEEQGEAEEETSCSGSSSDESEGSSSHISEDVCTSLVPASPSLSFNDTNGGVGDKLTDDTQDATGEARHPPPLSSLPRSAAELDEMELDSFLQWRRKLAKMEDEGVVLTSYEKNIQVWRQLWRVVERSHLVLHILDGRSPAFFRCKDLEKYILEVSAEKRILLVINKSDLLPLEARKEWFEYFRRNGARTIFFSALRELNRQPENTDEDQPSSSIDSRKTEVGKQESYENDAQENHSEDPAVQMGDYEIQSCDLLVDLLAKYRDEFRSANCSEEKDKPSEDFVVGIVGYPNVGKSSLINALLKAKKVSVSQQPGKTRRLQTIPLKGRGITLCDCPGLVFPKAVASKHVLVLNGIVPVDEMRGDYLPSIQMVCDAIPHTLLRHYNVTTESYRSALKSFYDLTSRSSSLANINEYKDGLRERLKAFPLLLAIASQRHFVSGGKGGQMDLYRVAKMILRDFTSGRLRHCNSPNGGIFGADVEAAEALRFLAQVHTSVETRFKEINKSIGSASDKTSMSNAYCQQQINPVHVLQELQEDADLLQVLEEADASQANTRYVPYVMTKRKARQIQKQQIRNKGNRLPRMLSYR